MVRRNGEYRRRLALEPLEPRFLLATSSLLWAGIDGHLIYRPDAEGDRIPDFSDVGYRAGREAIPDVPVVVTVSAGDGDDTARVQAAIDQVAAMPPGAGGFRGAVLLERGHYDIEGQLSITTGGVVLRGESRWADGTVLHARGDDRRTLVEISGSGYRQMVGPAVEVTDKYVSVGARSFHVADASELRAGDSILIVRPSTAEWIHDIGMDQLDNPWTPGSKDLKFERVITRIEGDVVTIDAPLTNSISRGYGGGTVQKFLYPGRIHNVGVENLRAESDYDSNTDEDHSWSFVGIDRAEDCWVRETKALYFAYAHVKIGRDAKWVTVEDAINHSPKSQITGGRRYAFAVWGQQSLVTGCESRDGRHDYVLHSTVAGPNVFHDSVADRANSDTGPHHRWSTGGLFDNVVSDGELNAENRWNWGTGHGWAGANMVFYNCTAAGYRVQNPITAQNWVIGSIGAQRDGHFADTLGELPGTYDSHGTPVLPEGLYEAQLAERTAYENLDYREHWLGDVDDFYSTGGTGNDVYVDPDWLARIAASHTVGNFDNVQGNVWVPFSFDFGLGPGEQVVGASLGLGMKKSGGLPNTDRIYLDALDRSVAYTDLGWSLGNSGNGYVIDLGGHLDLLQDGLLNLAVQDDSAVDWAVLNLQVTTPLAEVVARHVFYNDSAFDDGPAANAADDGAIAPDPASAGDPALGKAPLLPGQQASFRNVTSYSKGLNGIMVDVAGLRGTPTADDFAFKMGNDGNPDAWPAAPDPSITVRPGQGVGGSDRVTLLWPSYNTVNPDPATQAVAKQWLQVTVLDTDNTGLAEPDVFYFGNAPGDSGLGNSGDRALVNAVDSGAVRDNPHNPFVSPAPIDDFADFNRDRWVNAVDFGLVRDNATALSTALKLITAPSAGPLSGPEQAPPVARVDHATLHDAAIGELDAEHEALAGADVYLRELRWLDAHDSPTTQGRFPKNAAPSRAAVEKLLATL